MVHLYAIKVENNMFNDTTYHIFGVYFNNHDYSRLSYFVLLMTTRTCHCVSVYIKIHQVGVMFAQVAKSL